MGRSYRAVLTALAILALWAASGRTSWAGEAAAKAVLELFTSQGCSSCPAADDLLGKLAARDDLIALSLPVDYWDYLGWRDTLASHANTERQRSYAGVRGDGQVYTPQVVVNGLRHAIGSRIDEIETAIAATDKELASRRTSLTVSYGDNTLTIRIGAAPSGGGTSGTIWLAHVTRAAQVMIEQGENKGRTITYRNVVRGMVPVGAWDGTARILEVPGIDEMPGAADGCVVLLQEGSAGPILAAAELKSW